MSTYIFDTADNTYYCLPVEGQDQHGNPAFGDDDTMPYWCEDIKEAYNFGSVIAAQQEMGDSTTMPNTAIIEII